VIITEKVVVVWDVSKGSFLMLYQILDIRAPSESIFKVKRPEYSEMKYFVDFSYILAYDASFMPQEMRSTTSKLSNPS